MWAQRLADRRRLLAGFWTSSAMHFLELRGESTTVNRVIRQHWTSAIALFPRLKLTLRNILGGVFSFSEHWPAQKTSGDSDRQSVPTGINRRGSLSYTGGPRFEYSAATLRNDHPVSRSENGYAIQPGFRNGKSSAPLDRAFRRIETDEDMSLAWRRIALTPDALVATAKRIVASGNRTEERAAFPWNASSTLIHKQAATSPQAATAGPDSFAEELSPVAPKTSTIDVDELTSQVIREIDKRATAWRERMGRV
jgi:hypothetical protein